MPCFEKKNLETMTVRKHFVRVDVNGNALIRSNHISTTVVRLGL